MRMQEQNFEKQVRSKMDELSFVPSAPVWEKVEEQIRKKKDKRYFLFWLLPLLLITSGISWWLFTGKDASSVNNTDIVSQQKKTDHKPGGNKINETTLPSLEIDKIEQEKTNNITEPNNSSQTPVEDAIAILTGNKERKKKSNTPKARYPSPGPVVSSIPGQTVPSITTSSEITTQPVLEPFFLTFNRDSILNSRSLTGINMPHVVNGHEAKQAVKNNKWQFAYTAQGGVSGISNGIGVFAKSADMLMFDSAPNFNMPTTGGFGNAAAPPPPPAPSVPVSGFAFSAGLDVKRRINNRLGVFSGVRYAYYSNTLQVGSTVNRDTSFVRTDASMLRTESYFRNDANQHNYTNRYQFIQVPVAIEYKLVNKFPLYVQGGVKLEKLISSNALFYNKYAGVFIKDKEMLANTGLHLFTGFNYHFRSNKAFSFALGPQLQYGTTSLTKKSSNTQQHLYFVGLSTQFFFKTK
jgi:hypothetical protein